MGLHYRRVVPVGVHTKKRYRCVKYHQISNPGTDVASWNVLADAPPDLAELAQAKYVQRMHFERFGKV